MDHIAIVEDDVSHAQALQMALYSRAKIFTATSALGFQKLLSKEPIDLVISDYKMELGDGLRVLALCKEAKPRIPCILVTAFSTEELAVESLNLGADAYFRKPPDIFELRKTVDKLLSERPERNPNPAFEFGPFLLNEHDSSVSQGANRYRLTEIEFRIFYLLCSIQGKLVTREEIQKGVWGGEVSQVGNVIDTHLGNLKKKIPLLKDALTAVRGKGYIMDFKTALGKR